jgi:DNA-binding SARP family transcriptional activator
VASSWRIRIDGHERAGATMALTIDNWDALHRDSPVPAPRSARTSASALSSGLVARDRELSDLDRMLSLARHRRATAVVLRGEAGTGKSALLEAAVARAHDFRVIQLRGVRGPEGEVPAHWPRPIVELLARHRGDRPDRDEVNRVATSDGRAELTNECADALRAVVGDTVQPVLIAVDDCQFMPPWLPAALATALTTRLASAPVALVMAWTDAPCVESMDLWNADVTEHEVEGLPTIALCARLLEQHGYRDIAAPVLEWMFAQTHGNPLCLVDGYSRLTAQQRADWQPLPPVVPMGTEIVRAYGSALSGLPEATRSALGVVAAGRVKTSEYPQMFDELHLDPDALQPARALGVFVQRGDRIDFTHPLVAAAAYHLMSDDLRDATHRVLALTLSAHGNIERGAYHAGLASQKPDREVSTHHQQAARRSLDRGSPRDAARHEEAAAAFAQGPDGQAQSLARASGLWMMAGEQVRAAQCAAQAVDLAVSNPIKATALYHQARVRFQDSVGDEVVDLLLYTVTTCGPEDPVLAVLAHLDAAACCALGGRYDDAVGQATSALSISASLNSQLGALARASHGIVRLLAGMPLDPVSDIANPLSQLMRKAERFPSSPQVAFVVGLGALLSGPPEMADLWGQWIDECATTAGDQPLRSVAPLIHAMVGLATGRFADIDQLVNDATRLADDAGLTVVASRARSVSGFLGAARNDAGTALQSSALVLGAPDDVGPLPRVQAQVNLALIEQQAQRPSVSRTWIKGVMEFTRPGSKVGLDFSVFNAPLLGVMCLLGRSQVDAQKLLDAVEPSLQAAARHGSILRLLQGICEPDLDRALQHLQRAQSESGASPMLLAQIDLCAGVRLAAASRLADARLRLNRSRHAFEQLGAYGFAVLADLELTLDAPAAVPVLETVVIPVSTHARAVVQVAEPAETWSEAEHEWDISLLGEFTVSRRNDEVVIPQSLAAQALKIVTLHKKIHVDELVEMLWPDAAQGVGSRRLRNVLWRIRGACGDLLQREGNLICLARDAGTDIDRFEELATQALTCDGGTEEVAQLAEQAVAIYRGELLPGDRYADWAAAYREALLRRHASMLELLVTASLAEGRFDQALAYLERLIETDPFEEHYYLQVAEIHVEASQFHRARNALERASRMLVDLGVPPSPTLLRAKQSLPQD